MFSTPKLDVYFFDKKAKHEQIELSNGNTIATSKQANWKYVRLTDYVRSRNYYEIKILHLTGKHRIMIGIIEECSDFTGYVGQKTNIVGYSYYGSNGNKYTNGAGVAFALAAPTFAVGDVIGMDVDLLTGTVTFFKNKKKVASLTFNVGSKKWYAAVSLYDVKDSVQIGFFDV